MIKRDLFQALLDHMDEPEITMLTGPRQAGKTTLLKMVEKHLSEKGIPTLWFNLDIESDQLYFQSQDLLLKKIGLEFGDQYGIVFVDEIQRKVNAGLFLKGLFDGNHKIKWVVSGSGSIEIKENIQESLVGRKRLFELSTINFNEFFNYRTKYKYVGKLMEYGSVEQGKVFELLSEYLNYGGYPRVVMEEKGSKKQLLIEEIYRSYIEKDIVWLVRSDSIPSFSRLTQILAAQTGKLINYSELAMQCGLSVPTLKKFLWYAQKTYIIDIVTPHYTNLLKQITKSETVYFNDLGLKNFSIGLFGNIENVINQVSFTFQNFIYFLLKEKYKHTSATIHFWRTNDGAEVDFVVRYLNEVLPVEVKYAHYKKPLLGKSLHSFIKQYSPPKAYIVNLSLKEEVKVGKTVVYFIPFYMLADKLG
jgi:uncharacterized protein